MKYCIECKDFIPPGQTYYCETCFQEALKIKLDMLETQKEE